MASLTIHTAAFNRAYILGQAYESLKAQTCKDFEWIITDDGSDDGTEELVKSWAAEDAGFALVYNKLPHVGIPRALNSGVELASTEWFMMLDSDDRILPETVEKVLKWIREIRDDESFAGIGFARCFPSGAFMKDQTPLVNKDTGYIDATHLERKKYHLDMDMCEVHRVEVFKRYPFPCWDDEFYAPEQLSFFRMALDGLKLRWRAEKLYICDYLPDGQTKNDRLVKNNPMGFAMMYDQNTLIAESWKEKSINTVRMTALTIYAKHPEYILHCNAPGLAIATFPLGWLLAQRRKRQYERLN